MRWATNRGDQQPRVQRPEVEAAIETVGERGEVSSGVLAEGKRVVGTLQTGLEIAQDCVDPQEFGYVLGLSPAHDDGFVRATGPGDGTEAGQSVGAYRAARGEVALGPIRNRVQGESRHEVELDAQRMPGVGERDSRHEGTLVLRAPPGLAARALAAEVGVIDRNVTAQDVAILARGHRQHELVVHEPSRWVAHAQVALECQRRQAGLGLADQVDRQEPHAQGKLAALKDRASDERGLMTARIALKNLQIPATQHAVGSGLTARATKTVRPARALQCLRALRLRSVQVKELVHRQTGLELDLIHGHGAGLQEKTGVQNTNA